MSQPKQLINLDNYNKTDLEHLSIQIKEKQAEGLVHSYPIFVEKLFKLMDSPSASLHHAGTGIAGEGGEILDITKKCWVYGKDVDVEHLVEELGDIRFYYQAMLNMLGLTDEEIQAANIGKLEKRYPEGVYTDNHANLRLDKEGVE